MNPWVIVVIAIIVGGLVYSYWRQFSYSMVASACCAIVLGIEFMEASYANSILSDTFFDIAFSPRDILDSDRMYTVITSMYAHAGIYHLLFNVIGLAFIGTIFEQRIGPRPFIIIYLFAGVCGTLVFAGLRWNDFPVFVVGASGAISGVLGAFARMYPNERMRMFLMFFPLPPMQVWVIVAIFVMMQIAFVFGNTNIAWEAHIGGLLGGMLIAPYVARLPLHKRIKKMISINALRRLANTSELKTILRRIEVEEIADVRSAWIEQFLSKARCPHCGAPIKITRESVTCGRGHLL
ncbi:MAG: rhomboid family intramembrane serine protease [Candidatus Thermoplasmatota archaeon]|nr:rhomboid family intramembrane serine protease [Candidatus Thermoplasmatota archaeon]